MPYVLYNMNFELQKRSKKRPWLAEQTGISLSTINNWYSKETMPNLGHIILICDAFQISIDKLVKKQGDNMSDTDIPVIVEPALIDQTKMEGWICPVCGSGISPWVVICPCGGHVVTIEQKRTNTGLQSGD